MIHQAGSAKPMAALKAFASGYIYIAPTAEHGHHVDVRKIKLLCTHYAWFHQASLSMQGGPTQALSYRLCVTAINLARVARCRKIPAYA